MKKVLISSFDMEIGGVERSLISMLDNFDYDNYNVDLMLYSHSGELLNLINKKTNLLPERKKYKTFRMSIEEIIKSGNIGIAGSRLFARYRAKRIYKKQNIEESGYIQMQYIWKYSLPFLTKVEPEYDVAISYLWPHYFIADKVKAKTKIAWIHTDYSKININIEIDLDMWDKFDKIVAVSQDCKNAFLSKYPLLKSKLVVIENITSPSFIKKLSNEDINDMTKSESGFNMVSVGRYSHAKGFDNAIKAMKILKDRGYKDIRWYVVGYGPDEIILKELINKYNLQEHFILLGKKINPYPYIQNCDIYVQPSRYEGKAVTVTEAQILGKSVIVTDYPTAKSQVTSEVDGYITDLSIDGIANGIEKLYKDNELRSRIENNCMNIDYSNNTELHKLYNICNCSVLEG